MADKKRYLDEAGLSEYDALVKKALSNIKNGTTIVGAAKKDGNGNVIATTYVTIKKLENGDVEIGTPDMSLVFTKQ